VTLSTSTWRSECPWCAWTRRCSLWWWCPLACVWCWSGGSWFHYPSPAKRHLY